MLTNNFDDHSQDENQPDADHFQDENQPDAKRQKIGVPLGEFLPPEIMDRIFVYLDITDLKSFQLVCQQNVELINAFISRLENYQRILVSLANRPKLFTKFLEVYPLHLFPLHLFDPALILELFSKIDLKLGMKIIQQYPDLFIDLYKQYFAQFCEDKDNFQIAIDDAIKIMCYAITAKNINDINKEFFQTLLNKLNIKMLPAADKTINVTYIVAKSSQHLDMKIATMLVKMLRVLAAYERYKQDERQQLGLVRELSYQPNIFVNQQNLNLSGNYIRFLPNANLSGINLTGLLDSLYGAFCYNTKISRSRFFGQSHNLDLSGAKLSHTQFEHRVTLSTIFDEETTFTDCAFFDMSFIQETAASAPSLMRELEKLLKAPYYKFLTVAIAEQIIKKIQVTTVNSAVDILTCALESPFFAEIKFADDDPKLFKSKALTTPDALQMQARQMLLDTLNHLKPEINQQKLEI